MGQVITIQRYWKSAIKSRAAKLNLLYLQWLRYETNLIKDRKRQDAEYESILRKELAMMHPSKRRAAALKLEMKKAADKPTVIKVLVIRIGCPPACKGSAARGHPCATCAIDRPSFVWMQEKSEEIHDLDGLGLILRDEDIHAAIAASKTKQIGIPQLDEGDHEPETIEFKPQRKIKSNVPGEDGLYMNYVVS